MIPNPLIHFFEFIVAPAYKNDISFLLEKYKCLNIKHPEFNLLGCFISTRFDLSPLG